MPATISFPKSETDVRRPNKIKRYKPDFAIIPYDDFITDIMNILGMGLSMAGLMGRIKLCAWLALFCSLVGFANARSLGRNASFDDSKQVLSSFMLSISALVMSYLQNPFPLTANW